MAYRRTNHISCHNSYRLVHHGGKFVQQGLGRILLHHFMGQMLLLAVFHRCESGRTRKHRQEQILRVCGKPPRRIRYFRSVGLSGAQLLLDDATRAHQHPICGHSLPNVGTDSCGHPQCESFEENDGRCEEASEQRRIALRVPRRSPYRHRKNGPIQEGGVQTRCGFQPPCSAHHHRWQL